MRKILFLRLDFFPVVLQPVNCVANRSSSLLALLCSETLYSTRKKAMMAAIRYHTDARIYKTYRSM